MVIKVITGTLPWPWTPEDCSKRTLSRKHSISQKEEDDNDDDDDNEDDGRKEGDISGA